MKKIMIVLLMAASMTMSSCGSFGGMSGSPAGTTGTTGNNGTIGGIGVDDAVSVLGNILGNVLGMNKLSESDLYGSWKYSQPGVAFTSDNALAQAGGAVAAQSVKNQLKGYYDKIGIKKSNTQITFKEDKTFSAKILGKSFSGTYTFDSNDGRIVLQSLLINIPCYVERSTTSIGLMVESQKLMQLLQTVAALSGNSTVQGIGEISKQFNGVRLGFEMTK